MSATRNNPKITSDEEIVATNVVETDENENKKDAEKSDPTEAVTETLAATSLDTEEPVAKHTETLDEKQEETETHEAAPVVAAKDHAHKEESSEHESYEAAPVSVPADAQDEEDNLSHEEGQTASNEQSGAQAVRTSYYKSSFSLHARKTPSPTPVQEETPAQTNFYSPTR